MWIRIFYQRVELKGRKLVSQFDKQYNSIITDIIKNGISDEEFNVRKKWDSDGTPAHTLSVISKQMRFDNSELPILTTKKVA